MFIIRFIGKRKTLGTEENVLVITFYCTNLIKHHSPLNLNSPSIQSINVKSNVPLFACIWNTDCFAINAEGPI